MTESTGVIAEPRKRGNRAKPQIPALQGVRLRSSPWVAESPWEGRRQAHRVPQVASSWPGPLRVSTSPRPRDRWQDHRRGKLCAGDREAINNGTQALPSPSAPAASPIFKPGLHSGVTGRGPGRGGTPGVAFALRAAASGWTQEATSAADWAKPSAWRTSGDPGLCEVGTASKTAA